MPRTTSLRLLACVALALGATAQLGALLHLAVVPHVHCETHGAIEHGGAHADGDHAHAAAHVGASLEADGSSDHGHEQCSSLATRDERAAVPATALLLAAGVSTPPSTARAPSALRLASRALDLAPKTSPPA
jgi:hypothetical protein